MTTPLRNIFNPPFLQRCMQVSLFKSIVSSTVGGNAIGVVDLLYGKKNVNEFLIAKKLKLTINQTRNVLYRLADEGLVSFIRKKDSKKGGWYIYFWTLNSGKGLLKFRDSLIKNIEHLQQTIAVRSTGRFFFCNTCQLEFSEEVALGHQYTCPECGQVLELKDLRAEVAQHEKEQSKLKQMLVQVQEEVDVLAKKEYKARTRKHKNEERKKSAARAVARDIARKKCLALMPAKKPAKKPSSKKKSSASKSKTLARRK